MATRHITPATIGSILASILVILIVGYQGYIFTVTTKAAPVTDTSHEYDTSILTTELSPDNAKSVFLLTVPLTTPTNQTSGGIPYNPGELGKTDITSAGQ